MMLNQAAQTALAYGTISVDRWIEIEGLPYAFGSMSKDASWFTPRAVASQRLLGMRPALANVPPMLSSRIDVLNGGNMAAGSVSFELLDLDGLITSFANIATPAGYLWTDITAATTTIQVEGLGFITIDDLLYIGTETVRVTGVSGAPPGQPSFLTVQRGMFWSKPQAFGNGFPVGRRPYTFANRTLRYFNIFRSKRTAALTSFDTDKFLRFRGTIKELSLGDNRAVYALRADSLDKEIDRQAFTGGLKFTYDDGGGFPVNGNYYDEPGGEDDMFAAFQWRVGDIRRMNEALSPGLSNNETFVGKVGNEYMAFTALNYGGAWFLKLEQRGLYGSLLEEHKCPCTISEVLPIVQKDATSGEWDVRASAFVKNVAWNASADHPLLILLQILLSTGTGTNSSYDTLKQRWGMGVEQALVDITSFELGALEDPTVRFRGHVDEGTNFVQFMRELLKFAGFYFFLAGDGRLTVKRLRPPAPDEVYTGSWYIDNSWNVNKRAPKWNSNWDSAVQEVQFKYGWDGEQYLNITVFKIDDANIFAKGMAKTINVESKIVGPNAGASVGGVYSAWDVNAWLLQRVDYYRFRYGKPTPLVELSVSYLGLNLEVGDVVTIANATTPNVGGTRGLQYETGEVISVVPDEASHTVKLIVLMVPYSIQDYRYYAPSAILKPGQYAHYYYDQWTVEYEAFANMILPAQWAGSGDPTFYTQAGTACNMGQFNTVTVLDPNWTVIGTNIPLYDIGGQLLLNAGSVGQSFALPANSVLVLDSSSTDGYEGNDAWSMLWGYLRPDFNHKLFPL